MERKSRLMITNMVLENFKSYAGVQEIGPFHKRFTSIVGPNGSGKSNVIDALLFVFGKRAAQLRLKNVSELIHKSSNYPNLEFARVSVLFQLIYDDQESADNYEVVEGSEFVVTRTAMKNNQSKYTIDSSTSSFTEVGAVLRKHGIDLDNNRFLILQGEVEQIAMMKPKGATENDVGLLEYFEDIIGTNQLVPMIEEANKKLEAVNEVRTEKVSRVKIAEKERDNLSGSKQEAEDFMEMERNIQRKKNIQYQVYENISNKNSADMTERLNKISEKLQLEANNLKESEEQLKIFQKSYEKDTAEYNATNAELQKSTTEYEGFQRHDVKLQEDMKHTKAQAKKHQAVLEKETKRESECLEEAATLQVQIDKYTRAEEDLTRKKTDEEAKLDKIMEGLKEATADLREKLDIAQSRLAEAEKSVSSQQTEKEVLQNAIELLQARANGNSKQLQTARDKLDSLLQEREKSQQRVTSLQGETHSRLSASIASLEDTIRKCEAEEESLRVDITATTRSVEEAKVTLASQQNARGGANSTVEKILSASKKGGSLSKVKGIRGRLGDLATIAPEYDTAVSTACGQFDSIVVDTNAAAQACVEYLKENNLGRATFILLDQMDDWRARLARPVNTPQGVSRLFDLIQLSDPSLAPAFYSVLRDTLVVPDLDQATRIAYQGNQAVWRVVTMDGNLIDTSGTMSGGGKVVKTGGMKLTSGSRAAAASVASASEEEVTPAMVAQLEQKVQSLQTRLTECRESKATAERELKESRKQFKDISTEVEKARLAITRYNEQEGELRARIADLAQQCTLTPQEQAELQTQTARLSELESRMLDISPQQKEVASLQRQIRSVGGPALAAAQQSVDNATKQLVNVSSQLSTKQVEETAARKNAEKAAQAREKAQSELTKANEKLAALIAEQKEMENDAMVVVEALEALKERLSVMEEGLKSVTKEYHDLKTQVAKIKTVQVDLNVEAERISGELKESNETAKKYRLYASQVRKQFKEEQAEFQSAIKSVAMPPHPSTVKAAASSEGDAMDVVEPQQQQQQQDEEPLEDLPVYEPAQLEEFNVEEIKREINLLEAEKNKLKSSVNMSALLEYLKKDANYKSRLYDLEVITEERNKVRKEFDELRRQRLEAFMAGFGVISLKLKEMYQMITLGGDAELELVDSLDPFSEGIVFSVRPPKKSWKNISNLSGGEKTLSSLALVFALHHYKPTPLYVMDEIDAALDFKNVSIVANYIKDRTKDAQFIIISLRNNMFELADRLVGIYKTHDATKSVTINPKLFEEATSGQKGGSAGQESSGVPLGDVTNKVHSTVKSV